MPLRCSVWLSDLSLAPLLCLTGFSCHLAQDKLANDVRWGQASRCPRMGGASGKAVASRLMFSSLESRLGGWVRKLNSLARKFRGRGAKHSAGRNWEGGRSTPGRGRNGAAAARRGSVPSRPRSIPVAICVAEPAPGLTAHNGSRPPRDHRHRELRGTSFSERKLSKLRGHRRRWDGGAAWMDGARCHVRRPRP